MVAFGGMRGATRIPVWGTSRVQIWKRNIIAALFVAVSLAGIGLLAKKFNAPLLLDFCLYIWLVFGHWQAYATGGGVTALMLVFERLVHPISTRAFRWIVLGAFAAAASFTAWHDTYLSLKGREADLRFANLQVADYRAHAPTNQSPILFSPIINVPPPPSRGAEEIAQLKLLNENIKATRERKELSDKQLSERAINLANRMRELQAQYDAAQQSQSENIQHQIMATKTEAERQQLFQQREAVYMQFRNQFEFAYRSRMEGEARALRDAMSDKLPAQPNNLDASLFDSGSLAGAQPLNRFADYLESLARKLVQ